MRRDIGRHAALDIRLTTYGLVDDHSAAVCTGAPVQHIGCTEPNSRSRRMTLDHQSAILPLQGRRFRAWLDEVDILENGMKHQISPQSQYCEAVDIVLG